MQQLRWPSTPHLVVQPVRNGRGIVALRAVAPGGKICEVAGRVTTSAAVWRAWKTAPQVAANCFRFDADRYLSPRGQIGDFANHSCRPNAAIHKERGRLVLRAIRSIAALDEVTHDYSTLLGADDVWTMRCNCGERQCRGVVRSFNALPAATLRRYQTLGAIPAYILATRAT